MSITDPIADALTVVRNASRAKKETTEIKGSKIMGKILEVMKKEDFIKDYRFIDNKKQGVYRVYMKYQKGNIPAITGIRKVSIPSLRNYLAKDEIKKVFGGLGIAIISTSKGVLTDEEARTQNVGGEILCEVW